MEALQIKGDVRLNGEVSVSGSKNACLPIFASALLTKEECVFRNVPKLSDVKYMAQILEALGAKVKDEGNGTWRIKAEKISTLAPYDLVRKMRASICLLGPLVSRMKKAKVSLPGGCVIGSRPIDLHIKGLRDLNCDVLIEGGYIKVDASNIKGANIFLGGSHGSTVTGTANIIMASLRAEGETLIENAACEPEIVDLCICLQKMGAIIEGIGTANIKITGVKKLNGVDHSVIPDRIEAGTWVIATIATKGKVLIKSIRKEHLNALFKVLKTTDCILEFKGEDQLYIDASNAKILPMDISTMPYPSFPTDLQAQLCTLACLADGTSVITEKVYPERFMHVAELIRMGAEISREGSSAIIKGNAKLSGAEVMASDLRASASLVIASLCASGKSIVHRIYHLDRGYDSIDKKLKMLGVELRRSKF